LDLSLTSEQNTRTVPSLHHHHHWAQWTAEIERESPYQKPISPIFSPVRHTQCNPFTCHLPHCDIVRTCALSCLCIQCVNMGKVSTWQRCDTVLHPSVPEQVWFPHFTLPTTCSTHLLSLSRDLILITWWLWLSHVYFYTSLYRNICRPFRHCLYAAYKEEEQ